MLHNNSHARWSCKLVLVQVRTKMSVRYNISGENAEKMGKTIIKMFILTRGCCTSNLIFIVTENSMTFWSLWGTPKIRGENEGKISGLKKIYIRFGMTNIQFWEYSVTFPQLMVFYWRVFFF